MKYTITLGIAVFLMCLFAFQKEKKETKPNILFIAIDDLRPELGCYGAKEVLSPNIDKLAEESIVFNRAYCNVPVCGASRASLLTGILPTKTRFIDYKAKAQEDVPTARTLPSVFKEAGYTCISNGKIFHYNRDMMEQSWSRKPWMPKSSHSTSFDPETKKILKKSGNGRIYELPDVADSVYTDFKIAQQTIKDLKKFKKSGQPFFLACGFFRPHMPFYAPKKYWDLYKREEITIASNRSRPENAPTKLKGGGEYKTYYFGDYEPNTEEFHKMMRHGYMACVSYVDHLAGEVLNELEKLGLAENTIVVIWGDHGWHLGEHEFWGKHNTMHNALKVPLIIKVPNKINGETSQALIESVDIYPTLCDLAGLPVPETVMGESFKTILENPNQPFREAVYARFKSADAIVTKDFNYTLFDNGEQMLYHIVKDPEENQNVVDAPQHTDQVHKMKALLNERQKVAMTYQNQNEEK
ncbi:sulfatase [Flammeovirga pacifica]|uniref:Sulfatase N-terminal domain-containing protein n=1 Tax=Flammeovirga pacifica TaxID=915059 RepID=A0A1S1YTZ0_FLAPC|nr:sulfatase [Flammeovirga pacifica]OHX64504.1 hypothetical protein NH26_23285 [Flammeovirga pacifica]